MYDLLGISKKHPNPQRVIDETIEGIESSRDYNVRKSNKKKKTNYFYFC